MSGAELGLAWYAAGSLLDIASSIGVGNGPVQEGNPLYRGPGGTFRWAQNLLATAVAAPIVAVLPWWVGVMIGVLRGLAGVHNTQLRVRAWRRNRPDALRRRWTEQERRNGWPPE